VSELRSDDAAVAVWAGDFTPDDADLAALAFFRGAVDISDAFTEVEFCSVCVVDSFDLK